MVTVEGSANLLIGGEWRHGQGEQTFDIVEPATSELMARAAVAAPADVDRAIKSAREAFERGTWSSAPASARAKVLYKIAELIRADADRLATLEARNAGKPIRDAREQGLGGAQGFRAFGGAA